MNRIELSRRKEGGVRTMELCFVVEGGLRNVIVVVCS